jgi:hypothetical protein
MKKKSERNRVQQSLGIAFLRLHRMVMRTEKMRMIEIETERDRERESVCVCVYKYNVHWRG